MKGEKHNAINHRTGCGLREDRKTLWFAVDDNGLVHDRENHYRFMKTAEAVTLIHEGMTSYKDCRLTKKEIKVFEALLESVGKAKS